MTPIQTLIAKVEAGEAAPSTEWADALGFDLFDYGRQAYSGSLDAAISLLEAVLPGWVVAMDQFFKGGWDVSIQRLRPAKMHCAFNDNPARALLLCILKAMEDGE